MEKEKFQDLSVADIVRFERDGVIYIRRVKVIKNDEVVVFDYESGDGGTTVVTRDALSDEIVHVGETIYDYNLGRQGIVTSVSKYECEVDFGGSSRSISYENGDGYMNFKIIAPEPDKTTVNIDDQIVRDVVSVLSSEEVKYPFAVQHVNTMVDTWRTNKAALINLLRKHPNWDETNMCVKGQISEIREQGNNEFLAACKAFYVHCYNAGKYFTDEELDIMWDGVQCTPPEKFVTPAIASRYEQVGVKMTVGAKYSRELNKIFISMGLDKFDFYNKDFAKISDTINPLDNVQNCILSVHPCDYLKMSWGEKWNSCHDIRTKGCYHAGTQSYMMDESSMVFYTISNHGEDIPWKNNKLTRQIFAYENGALLQSRCYPNNEICARNDEYRRFVKSVFDVCLGVDSWVDNSSQSTVNATVVTKSGSTHYPDYLYEQYHTRVSFCLTDETKESIIHIGHKSLNLMNGMWHSHHEHINQGYSLNNDSRSPSQDPYYICCCSGYRFHQGDGVDYIGYNESEDNWYSEDYFRTCDICGEVYFGDYDDGTWHNDNWYCPHCAENRLRECERCGEYFDIYDEGVNDDTGCYCDECLEDAYYCECCGHYDFSGDGDYVDGVYHCCDCLEEGFERCCDCEEYFEKGTLMEYEGEMYCPECYEKLVRESSGDSSGDVENPNDIGNGYRITNPDYILINPRTAYDRGYSKSSMITKGTEHLCDMVLEKVDEYDSGGRLIYILRTNNKYVAIRSEGVESAIAQSV